jgi:hypothetical protein
MWLLHLLPTTMLEYVVNSILFIGLVLTVLSFVFISPMVRMIPAIAGYYKIIQIISIIILCAGIYVKGGYTTEKLWRNKVEKVEQKLKIAEAKAGEVKIVIQEKVVFRNKIIKEKADEIIKYVDREVVKKEEVVKFMEVCPIPVDIIKLHNEATRINLTIDELTRGKK